MATHTTYVNQTISTRLILTIFVAMIMAFAFVAILTNMIVNSKVNAAYQSNPVTVAAPTQTNTAPTVAACTLPTPASSAATQAATDTGSTPVPALPWSGGYAIAGSYSQSNSSVINTSSTNSYVTDSYNTTTTTSTDNRWSGNSVSANNGNTYTDNRNSGNTYTDNRNSGNTTTTNTTVNTDNSNNSTNTNIQDSGNTTTLNTLIDNSQQNNTAVAVGGLGVAVVAP